MKGSTWNEIEIRSWNVIEIGQKLHKDCFLTQTSERLGKFIFLFTFSLDTQFLLSSGL